MAKLPDNPSIGYIALLLLLLGLFLILSGLGIIKTDKVTVAHGFKTWFFGLLIMVFGSFLGAHELKLIDIKKSFSIESHKDMIPNEKSIPASLVANTTKSKEKALYRHEEVSNETFEDFKKTSDAKYLNSAHTDKKTTALLLELCMHANSRSVVIIDALFHLQEARKTGRSCMTKEEYLSYSTRDFDKKFPLMLTKIREHIGRVGVFESEPKSEPSRWLKTLFSKEEPSGTEIKHLNDFCMVQLSLGEKYFMSLRDFRKKVDADLLSKNPHAPLEQRWGIPKEKYIPDCPIYN